MREFLDSREDNYVRENFTPSSVNKYVSKEQYCAMLKRIHSVSSNLQDSLKFLQDNSNGVSEAIESALSIMEIKLQVIRQSAKFLSKVKFETRLTSPSADISIIDISKGSFNNVNYSVTDRGLVMNSDNTINLRS